MHLVVGRKSFFLGVFCANKTKKEEEKKKVHKFISVGLFHSARNTR